MLLALLVVNGIATHGAGQSGTPPRSGEEAGAGVGTIFGWQASSAVDFGRDMRGKVALTFDDGPDERWTPQVASVLERLDAPATFFVTGQRAAANAGMLGDLVDAGFEIGNHTFSHADVAAVPGWRRELELSMTDAAIAGAAGVRPRLFRPPYTGTVNEVNREQAAALAEIARSGYVVALSDFDSKDWSRPGVEAIVRNSLPSGREGGVVLLHDGGGDRAQTVTALTQLIPRLRARGFEIVPLSELVRAPTGSLEPAASTWERVSGRAFLLATTVARAIAFLIAALLVPIAILAILRAIAVVYFAIRHARTTRAVPADEDFTPPVSIIVPAYNEEKMIESAVRSLAASDYPELEVIVVDDGSTDATAELVEAMGLESVQVIRQPNAGKPVALNTGVAAARHELLVMVDADTIFEPGTMRRLVQPFRDPGVGAAAGNTKVGNRHGLLGRWQHIDYVTGFNLDRRLYEMLRCMPTVPGAIGAFRREALREVGGLSSATLAEDTDLTIAIGRLGWHVVYVEDARAYTEAPPTLAGLWRQRYRWSYGTMQAVWKHRAALLRREPGPVGRRGLPYLLLFQVLLPILAPLIDVFTIYGVLFLDPLPVLAYWLGFNTLMLSLAGLAFHLDGESKRPLVLMPLQQFVYRQLMYLVVIQSAVSALRGVRLRWQHVERSGELEIA